MSVTITGYLENGRGGLLYYRGVHKRSGQQMMAYPPKGRFWLEWTSADLEWIIVQ